MRDAAQDLHYYLRALENEVQELNQQLRKAREDIFGLVQMYNVAIAQREEAMSNPRQMAGQLASVRKEPLRSENHSQRKQARSRSTSGNARGIIDHPKTIV